MDGVLARNYTSVGVEFFPPSVKLKSSYVDQKASPGSSVCTGGKSRKWAKSPPLPPSPGLLWANYPFKLPLT